MEEDREKLERENRIKELELEKLRIQNEKERLKEKEV